jgi:hypothetical protein
MTSWFSTPTARRRSRSTCSAVKRCTSTCHGSPHGVIVFNTSNRHFNLVPVVAALARDAGPVCRVRLDVVSDQRDLERGNTPSEWAVMARTAADLGALAADPRWEDVTQTTAIAWTDDHSNVLSALR